MQIIQYVGEHVQAGSLSPIETIKMISDSEWQQRMPAGLGGLTRRRRSQTLVRPHKPLRAGFYATILYQNASHFNTQGTQNQHNTIKNT